MGNNLRDHTLPPFTIIQMSKSSQQAAHGQNQQGPSLFMWLPLQAAEVVHLGESPLERKAEAEALAESAPSASSLQVYLAPPKPSPLVSAGLAA
jgi:hypothetical protein